MFQVYMFTESPCYSHLE